MTKTNKSGRPIQKPSTGAGLPSTTGVKSGVRRDNAVPRPAPNKR